MPQGGRRATLSVRRKLGRSDRYPSDYGVRDEAEREKQSKKGQVASWAPGDKGQGREGYSKGYGGSEGDGTGSFRAATKVAVWLYPPE
jgi:hypothetical protein